MGMRDMGMRGEGPTGPMTETLREGLERLRGRPVHLAEVHRESYFRTSSFRAERWRVRLEGGECLEVFFKDLNPRHQSEAVQVVRQARRQLSDCELQMYRQVLSRPRFGTPELYAFRWDPAHDLYWLFLEHAGSVRLNEVSDFNCWLAAARWSARFHAATRRLPPEQTAFLVRYDRAHYRHCAERVEKKLPDLDTPDRAVIRQALDAYRGLLDGFAALPQSVLHGEFFSKNIVLRPGDPAGALAVIDWETAALGPSYIDLVSITSGKWDGRQKRVMWRAYFDQYRSDTGLPLDWEGFCRDLGGLSLYNALRWLGWWPDWNFRHIGRWVKELTQALAPPDPGG